MSVTYYVDPLHGHDDNDGASWAQAKQTIAGALELIPEILTEKIIIQVKPDNEPEPNRR